VQQIQKIEVHLQLVIGDTVCACACVCVRTHSRTYHGSAKYSIP